MKIKNTERYHHPVVRMPITRNLQTISLERDWRKHKLPKTLVRI